MRGALVVAECMLAVMLLGGAALLIRSLGELQRVDTGFQAVGRLLVRVSLPQEETEARAQRSRRGDERMISIIERLATVPGVRSVGSMRDFVFTRNPDWVVTAETDRGMVESDGGLTSDYVTPGRFNTLGATMAASRDFDATDLGSHARSPW
jgi:putative ABC transport system permease protein